MTRNLTASNPVPRVKFFNEDNSQLRYLPEGKYNRLLQAAKTVATSPFFAEKIPYLCTQARAAAAVVHLRWDYLECAIRGLAI